MTTKSRAGRSSILVPSSCYKEKDDGSVVPILDRFFVAATHKAENSLSPMASAGVSGGLIEANQSNALVLSFIPSDTPVSQLSGYSLAKDDNDYFGQWIEQVLLRHYRGDWLDVPENIVNPT